jgi:NADPH-dependent 2,4-dienoyl-CoA reductase/sulfur reductase-like enzyme/nitrite reductase/ring-hydroxylating ferredoxin subunit
MAGGTKELKGPDFGDGFDLASLREGEPVLGHMDGDAVLLVLLDGTVHAAGASCTHYGGPLGEGLVEGDTVRCPLHHACFSLRTGEALTAPALNPVPTWEVRTEDGRVTLGAKRKPAPLSSRGREAEGPGRVVIVGAGAAGSAAAEMLRREGYAGDIVMVDPDPDAPYDRPNLSKDYLAGSAPEEWIPLRPDGFYEEHGIERVRDRATGIDRAARNVTLADGDSLAYDALLIATGATPRTLPVVGAERSHVHVLRSLEDSRRIIADAEDASRAVVIGASFIGMEVAASLRAREIDVTVVAPEEVPFERVLGAELGELIRGAHEENGVEFRLGRTVERIEPDEVILDDGEALAAGLVVVGVGVRPDTALAEDAGLDVDDGILVDELLRTSDPHVWAAGDNARWPDPASGRRVRIEHWVVAQRMGQAAARNILGREEPFRDVPFFWTHQFDVVLRYVGHAEDWDRVESEGSGPEDRAFRYVDGDRLLALATIGRDRQSLETEARMGASR